MTWFDNLRVELAMRSVLSDSVGQMIDRMEEEYNLPTTSAARKEAIFRQGQDAIMTATLASMHVRGQPQYAVEIFQNNSQGRQVPTHPSHPSQATTSSSSQQVEDITQNTLDTQS